MEAELNFYFMGTLNFCLKNIAKYFNKAVSFLGNKQHVILSDYRENLETKGLIEIRK